jgi:DNA (cytosine-5)-methyltransferase 1
VGDTVSKGLEGHAGDGTGGFRHLRKVPKQDRPTGPASLPGVGLADAHGAGQRSGSGGVRDERDNAGRGGAAGELGNSAGARRNEWRAEPSELGEERLPLSDAGNPWDDVVWLPCSDGKARPTQSGIFPLVDGVPNRVGTLRGAGNAIVPQAAAEFVRAFLEARRAR